MKQSIFRSPILSLSEKPLFEDFSSSIQKNTTNESYSLTDKGTLAFTTSNKKIKTSFEDMNSNGKLEAIIGNVIEFEEFNPIIRDNNNLTGQFGKNLEEIRKINENSERMSEVLNRENEDFKKKIVNQAKEIDFLKENMMMLDKNSYSSSNIAKIERRNEELLKEIVMLKQNLIEMNQNCKDSDIENIKLKEEIEYRGEKIQKLIEKNKNLEKNFIRKDQKIENFVKELSKIQNQTDSDSLAQQNLVYSEKINQMNELIETQRHVITKNDKKMQNLIKKLDELNLTNNTKSSEISKLKYENSSLRNEMETLNNRVFIKNNESSSSAFYKTQMDLYQKEKILSRLDENLENLEANKQSKIQQKLKKTGNKSNHLAHASLNFELDGNFGFGMQTIETKENIEQKFIRNDQIEHSTNLKNSSSTVNMQSPKQIVKKNLSLAKAPECQKEMKYKQSQLSNEKQSKIKNNKSNCYVDIDNRLSEKVTSPNKQSSSAALFSKSKSKEKKSLTDLNNLVNQITNRSQRPPKNDGASNSNHSKVDVSGKNSAISKSNKSSNSMQYSGENGNVSSNKEFKSNNAKNLIFNEKENLTLRTDRPPSSDFKNFKNLKAPQKMFGNKNTFLTNNYLRNDLHEEDFDYLKRIRNYNI